MTTPALPLTPDLVRRLSGEPMLLLLDIDGTLAPIAPRPEFAAVPPETRSVVEALVRLPYTRTVIITGRAAADGAAMVRVDGTWIIGNHGLEIAEPGGAPQARADALPFAPLIATASARCRAIAGENRGVIVEDKRWSLSVHYRLAEPWIVPEVVAGVTMIAEELGLRITLGKAVIEIRPPLDVNKGTAAIELVDRLGALAEGSSIFCGGDDRTDEDAFKLLRSSRADAVTVRVGDESAAIQTSAEFGVPNTDGFRALLEAILELRMTPTAGT